MAERLLVRVVGIENVGTEVDAIQNSQGIAKADISIEPLDSKRILVYFWNDIPVVATNGSPTVSFEYGSDEPDWTTYVTVTDGDHATGHTLAVDSTKVDMDTVGTFDVVFVATDSAGNASDAHTIEITITDSVAPVITLTSTTVDVTASEVATWTPTTNIATAVDAYDGDVSGNVVFAYKQETSGGTAIADLAGARTYLGTEGNAVYVTYNVDDSSENSATQKTATFTAVADA